MSTSRKKPIKINRFYISALILFTFTVALNGPISRTVITHFTNKGLESLGLRGYFFLNGSIIRGFSFNDINYSGDQAVQKLSIRKLAIDYRLIREVILKQKIRSFSLNQINLTLDLSRLPKKAVKNQSLPLDFGSPPDFNKIAETLNIARHWIKPSEIKIDQANIKIRAQTEPVLEIQFDSLNHASENDNIELIGYQLKILNKHQTPIQNSTLTWLDDHFKLSHLEALPKIGIDSFECTLSPAFKAGGSLLISDATLVFQISPERLQLELTDGSIQSGDIMSLLPITVPVAGSVQQLSIDLYSWLMHPCEWQLQSHITLAKVETEAHLIEGTQVTVNKVDESILLDFNTNYYGAKFSSQNKITLNAARSPEWFKTFNLESDTHISNITKLASDYIPERLEIDTDETAINLKANCRVSQMKPSHVDAELTLEKISIADTPLPNLNANVQINDELLATLQCDATLQSRTLLNTQATIDIPTLAYQAKLNFEPIEIDWINAIFENMEAPIHMARPMIFSWEGCGTAKLKGSHKGDLELQAQVVEPVYQRLNPIDLATKLEYEWPNNIQIRQLLIKDQKIQADLTGLWDGNTAQVSTKITDTKDDTIATLQAEIPFNLEHFALKDYLQLDRSIELLLKTEKLPIQQTLERFSQKTPKAIKDLSGNMTAELELKGSIAAPTVSGFLQLGDLRQKSSAFQSPIHLNVDFHSESDMLLIDSQIKEIQTPRVDASFKLPFTPKQWLRSENDLIKKLKAAPLFGTLEIHQIPLERLKELAPQIQSIDGTLEGNAKFTGTINDPQFTLNTNLRSPNIKLDNGHIDRIKDLQLDCTILSDHTLTAKLNALVNGSDTRLIANVDFKNIQDPSFKISASTDHALLFRNDKISIRANANIYLDGILSDALVSGNLNITESLLYQDIDILPIGVPNSAVANVDLPPVHAAGLPLPIQSPFADWKLDVTLDFDDPLLIRGNIARGEVAGTVKATGTIASPKLDGEIATKGVVAKLPFSELKIRKGRLLFDSSKHQILPILDVQGTSLVNRYQTELFIYGSPLSPKVTLSSQPPLPQSDIVTLIATGITPNDLKNNKEAATLRALQLFLVKFKQESKNKTSAKIIANLLSSIQEFEFNVNETDTFTGRKFSSARMQVHPKVFITAQVDEEKNTRGLVVFFLKFD